MDGKSLVHLALTAIAVVVCCIAMFQEKDGGAELDRDKASMIETNENQIRALREEIQNLSKKLDRTNAKPGGMDSRDVEDLVAKVLAERANAQPQDMGSVKDAVAQEEKDDGEFNFDKTMAAMIANSGDWEGKQELWAKLKKAGKLDEAIKWLEDRAKNSPNDPEAHCDLAESYIAKLQTAGSDFMLMGALSQKADKAFDKVLELDDQHWRGRFQKAVSLSFWPPAMGKQGEAIKHFEILASQQENQPANPGHAMTHMFLGNMYSQQGKSDKARAAWQAGLKADPENAQLQKLLSNSGGN